MSVDVVVVVVIEFAAKTSFYSSVLTKVLADDQKEFRLVSQPPATILVGNRDII